MKPWVAESVWLERMIKLLAFSRLKPRCTSSRLETLGTIPGKIILCSTFVRTETNLFFANRLRVELEIMLENCEILWAKKIRQIEMNANCRIDTSPSPKDTFVARIDAALEKMDLKCQEARISCVRRCVSVSGTSMAARAVHDWRQAVLKMEKVKADYEKGLKHRLERSEGV